MARKTLLLCGILSTLLYAAMNVFVPMQWAAYSSVSQTISELSAIGAPTRPLWAPFGILYTVLVIAFGVGVWRGAREHGPLDIVGRALITQGILGLGWPPMHQRAVLAAGGGTLTDTLHLVWSFMTAVLMLLAIGYGASAFGKRFRLYSFATIATVVVFVGILTGMDAPRVQADLPTPWLGVWERIGVGANMLWVAVLAVVLLRRRDAAVVSERLGARAA